MHVRGGCTDLVFIRWEGIDEATTGFVMEVSRHGLADDEERPAVGIDEVLLTNDDIIDRLKVSLRIRVGDLLVDIVNPVVVMKVHHCLLAGGEEACNVDRAVALAQGVEGSLEKGVDCLKAVTSATSRVSTVEVAGWSIATGEICWVTFKSHRRVVSVLALASR